MNDERKEQPTLKQSFIWIPTIGTVTYLVAWGVFHAYTIPTVLFPILISDLIEKISGPRLANSALSPHYLAVCVAAVFAGLLFSALYWPIEKWITRHSPTRLVLGRILAAVAFFLLIWLAFPLRDAL